ncbi:hypothetical protein CC78DRAFT_581504 [Lojkania enalia]|uniref:Uncharacterized protein n=1 Tax=Lojkania enalia TaxID=147567 RepID=A0A9P4N3A8_9PLEO|nr:hypothetical protein CC78DRAFT_581504 [Didymosphaeria enalia]
MATCRCYVAWRLVCSSARTTQNQSVGVAMDGPYSNAALIVVCVQANTRLADLPCPSLSSSTRQEGGHTLPIATYISTDANNGGMPILYGMACDAALLPNRRGRQAPNDRSRLPAARRNEECVWKSGIKLVPPGARGQDGLCASAHALGSLATAPTVPRSL